MKTTSETETFPLAAALSAWRQTREAHAEAAAALQKLLSDQGRERGTRLSNEGHLARLNAEIRDLEADDGEWLAAAAADRELFESELANGDAIAIACDPRTLRVDLAGLVEAEAAARVAYEEAKAATAARVALARDSARRLFERRQADDLPQPARRVPPPAGSAMTANGRADDPAALLAALELASETPAPPPAKHAEKIARLRAERTELLAGLERERRDEEAATAAREADEEAQRQDSRKAAARREAEGAALAAAQAAEEAKRNELASAYERRGA